MILLEHFLAKFAGKITSTMSMAGHPLSSYQVIMHAAYDTRVSDAKNRTFYKGNSKLFPCALLSYKST